MDVRHELVGWLIAGSRWRYSPSRQARLERVADILYQRYWAAAPESRRHLGAVYGVTPARIGQLERLGLGLLRRPPRRWASRDDVPPRLRQAVFGDTPLGAWHAALLARVAAAIAGHTG